MMARMVAFLEVDMAARRKGTVADPRLQVVVDHPVDDGYGRV